MDALKEKALEVVSAIRTVNRSRNQMIEIEGDDEPCFWQRKEWVDWMLDLAFELEVEVSAHFAAGGMCDDMECDCDEDEDNQPQ